MATTEAGKETLLVARFVACIGFHLPSQAVDLHADNKGAISLTENPEFHRKTKHIEVRWLWIREKVERKEIAISNISTKEMLADRLTKALSPKIFKDFRRMIRMTWAGHFRPSGSVEAEGRTSWKVMEVHRRSWNVIEPDERFGLSDQV